MTDPSRLGGGYAESQPDPHPTTAAVLEAARPGAATAHLVVLAGPPGVGKSAVAGLVLSLLPHSFAVDKDQTAAGFILQSASDRALPEAAAYGSAHYWHRLRPLEYAGATALACANLVGTRTVLLIGGWGPELGVENLWTSLARRIAPARLSVIHLEPPPLKVWRARMAGRGSRCDSPWFEGFAAALSNLPVWTGARRIETDGTLTEVGAAVLEAITTPLP